MTTSAFTALRSQGRVLGLSAGVAVLLFFSGLAQYVFVTGLVPTPPTYAILPFVALAAVVTLVRPSANDTMGWAVIAWAGAYLLISIVGVLQAPDPHAAVDILEHRLLSVMFLLAMRTICGSAAGLTWSIRAIVLVELTTLAFNVYEWFNPLTFSLAYGRSAGLYQNPNITGGALVLGMLVGLPAVPRRWREIYLLAAGAGVVLTVSRGALVGWLLATLCLLFSSSIGRRRLVTVLVATLVLGFAGAEYGSLNDSNEVLRNQPDLFRRLSVDGSMGEENTESRLNFVASGFNHFLSEPGLGAGLGATESEQGLGTHNVYVMHLGEHGVLGGLLVPSLLLLILIRARSLKRQPVLIGCAMFLASWGFFSHNVLDEFHLLLVIALILAPYGVAAPVWNTSSSAAAFSFRRRKPSPCAVPPAAAPWQPAAVVVALPAAEVSR